jgi:hypothetical protein
LELFWHCGFQVRICVHRVDPRAGLNRLPSSANLIALESKAKAK